MVVTVVGSRAISYNGVQMVITRDHPVVMDHIGLLVKDSEFFILLLHSTAPLILIILSERHRAISDGDIAVPLS